jgi:hypothetical protein
MDKEVIIKKVLPGFIASIVIFLLFMISFSGCDELLNGGKEEDSHNTLYVKFHNDSSSLYTIYNIQLNPMGNAGEIEETVDSTVWGDNILKSGEKIAPGEHKFFTLKIPNNEYSIYRLGVIDSNGDEIMIHEQSGYSVNSSRPTITHWGSDERTAYVVVKYLSSKKIIYISGYGDWAGVEGE